MDPITVGIGALALILAVYSGVVRFVNPGQFKKLEPMKKLYGNAAGNTIHFVAYVLVPFAFGIAMISAGLKGISFFQI